METNDNSNDLYEKVLDQFIELFVSPEVKKRQENGRINKSFILRAFQVVFFPDGRKPQVRLNNEIKAIAQFKKKKGVTKSVGDPVYEHEIEGVEEVRLCEDEADYGHATFFKIKGNWVVAFDFRYNKVISKKHIETAYQFLDTAEFALEKRNWSPFIDNLFSAIELLAKCMLLSLPATKISKRTKHKGIHSEYNRLRNLGLYKAEYVETFNKLWRLRHKARYLSGELSITDEEAREYLNIVKNKIEDASRYIGFKIRT